MMTTTATRKAMTMRWKAPVSVILDRGDEMLELAVGKVADSAEFPFLRPNNSRP